MINVSFHFEKVNFPFFDGDVRHSPSEVPMERERQRDRGREGAGDKTCDWLEKC